MSIHPGFLIATTSVYETVFLHLSGGARNLQTKTTVWGLPQTQHRWDWHCPRVTNGRRGATFSPLLPPVQWGHPTPLPVPICLPSGGGEAPVTQPGVVVVVVTTTNPWWGGAKPMATQRFGSSGFHVLGETAMFMLCFHKTSTSGCAHLSEV